MRRRHFNQAFAASAALLASGLPRLARSAEGYPDKPIRLVVSYGAGGSLDVIARPLAVDLGKSLGQSLIVTNVPGASGAIGVRRVREAAPDGYTLLVGTASEVVLAPFTVKAAGYGASDLTAIGKVATSGLVIAARPGLGVSSLQELIAMARAKPGLTFGVPGAGSFHHVAMESLMHRAGLDLTMVPYPSSAQVITDLLGGHIGLGVVGLPALLPSIQGGQVKALAVMGKDRDIGDPAIPTVRETPGLENFDFDLWTGLFAPRGIPAQVATRLHDALTKSLGQAALREQYRKIGVMIAQPQSAAGFADYVRAEESKLKEAVARSGIAAQ